MTKFKAKPGSLHVADNSKIPTIGTATYGILNCIICPSLAVPLISVKSLTKLGYYILFMDTVALILRPILNKNKSKVKYKIVTSARLHYQDNLYHVDDMSIFLDPSLQAKYAPNFRAHLTLQKRRKSMRKCPPDLEKTNQPIPIETVNPPPLLPQPPPLPLTAEQFLHGSYRTSTAAARYGLNIIEWLHLIFGHLSEKYIRWIVKSGAVKGIKVTSKDLKNIHMRLCYACLIAKMRAFPIYESLNDSIPMPLRKITSDYKLINGPEIYGRTCYFLFADADFDKWWFYPAYSMTDWFECYKHLIESEQKKTGYNTKIFQTDFNKMPVADNFAEYLKANDIEYQSSAPYKKQQSLSETQINIMDNGIRSQLTYNQVPSKWWSFAGECLQHIHNELPKINHIRSRNDEFYSHPTVHSDISSFVPFYSKGVAHLSPDERLKLTTTKALDDHGLLVHFVGYATEFQIRQKNFPIVHLKDSYIVYRPDNGLVEIRHDCIFPGTTAIDIASFDINGIDSFDQSRTPTKINEQLANEKTLFESYDRAFGKWKSHHWTAISNIQDPNDQPIYTIVPRFDNSDLDPRNPDDGELTDAEKVHVRIELDDYGFVKQPPKTRISKLKVPPPPSTRTPRLNRVKTPAGISLQQTLNTLNAKAKRKSTGQPLDPSVIANLATALEKHSIYQTQPKMIKPSVAAKIIDSYIPIEKSWSQSLPDQYTIQPHTLDQQKDDLLHVITTNLSRQYQKKLAKEGRAARILKRNSLRIFKAKLATFKAKLDSYSDPLIHIKRRQRKIIQQMTRVNNKHVAMLASLPTPTEPTAEDILQEQIAADKLLAELTNPPTKTSDSNSNTNLRTDDPLSKDPNEQLSIKAPSCLLEAFLCKEGLFWYEAWIKEMERVEVRHTYGILPDEAQSDKNIEAIKSKYAFRLSLNADGTFKFKVRLVACGYSQRYGKDFTETYSPTAKFKSFTTIMHLAAIFNWDINGLDVENAFIETDIDIPINMYLPSDVYRNPDGSKVKVQLFKSLYGLKQAGELFYQNLRDKIIKTGFQPLIHDQCVYIKRNEATGAVTIIICYVDDVIVTGNDPTEISSVMSSLASHFTKITEVGNVTKYVGIEMDRNRENRTIHLHQTQYVDKLLYNSPAKDQTSKQSPLPESVKFDHLGDNTETPIRDRIGTFRFLADRTRPSILEAVGLLGQASHNPSKIHIRGCNHLDRYLLGSKSRGIKLGGSDKNVILFAYSDASYISGATRIGYCFFLSLDSGTIYARSTKSNTVSHSSTESEIKAIDECIRQLTWMRGFLAELGFPQLQPTEIKVDNKSAIFLADKFQSSNNTAHIVTRLNYIHQEVAIHKNISLTYINTEDQVADILTKLLPVPQFIKLEELLQYGHNNIAPIALIKDKNIDKHKIKPFDYRKHNNNRTKLQSTSPQKPPILLDEPPSTPTPTTSQTTTNSTACLASFNYQPQLRQLQPIRNVSFAPLATIYFY